MRRLIFIAPVSALILLAAARCTPATRDRVVRFFFEVPEPTSQPATQAAAHRWESRRQPWASRAMFVSTHVPFIKRECETCHDAEHPSNLRADPRTVCGACHVAVFTPRPYLHGPFASGACAMCHQPHVSTLTNLLREADPQQCLGCHEWTPKTICSGQRMGVAQRCLACHEPHAANEEYMLKPRSQWEHLLLNAATPVHGDGPR